VVGAVDVDLGLRGAVEGFEFATGDALCVVGHITATDFAHADGGLELAPLNLVLRLQQTHAGLAGSVDVGHLVDVLLPENHVLWVPVVLPHSLNYPSEAVLQHSTTHVDIGLILLAL
jgi:hypothetical protein